MAYGSSPYGAAAYTGAAAGGGAPLVISYQAESAFGGAYGAPLGGGLFDTYKASPAFGAAYGGARGGGLFLSYQAESAFGGAYGAPLGGGLFLTYKASSAYGAGYGAFLTETTITVSPVQPVGVNAYLARQRTARATAYVTVPVAPPPPPGGSGPGEPPPLPGTGPGDAIFGVNLAPLGIPQVSETFPTPIIIGGQPYADSNRTPWKPTVARSTWATQLQVEVGGEDVTFFRGVPTEVQSWASQEPFGDSSAVFVLPAITSFDQLRQPLAVPTGITVGMAGTFTNAGYWTASVLGLVTGFGDAGFFGDPLGLLNAPVSGIASSSRGYGYALCAEDGGVFCFGSVPFKGSIPGLAPPNNVVPAPVISIALSATGMGYWLLDQLGQVYAFGDANYMGGIDWSNYPNMPKVNSLIPGDVAVSIARSGSGNGYYIITAAGHIYCFGDVASKDYGDGAPYYIAPYTGIATSSGVNGYVLVNTLGRTYAFGAMNPVGDVTFPLNAPADSIASTGTGGYWIGAEDGGVFAFGNAGFFGSVPGGGTTAGGSLSWLYLGAPIAINRVAPDGSVSTLFEGVVADWEDRLDSGEIGLTVQCTGSLFQLDWYIAKPIPNLPFQGYSPETGNPIFGWDIALAIPTAIASVADPTPGTAIGNGVVPTPRLSPFNGNYCVLNIPGGGSETGILTVTQPAWDKLLTSYIQNILSQAETFGGLQYTVGLQRPRTPVLGVKDFETVNWTVSTGGSGIKHDLSLDISTAANAIYGSGTAPPIISTLQSGGSTTTSGVAGTWAGAKFPRIPVRPAPVFPLGAGSFSPGGLASGFLPFTNWMRQSGWPMTSQDTYIATDAALGNLDYFLILNWQVAAGSSRPAWWTSPPGTRPSTRAPTQEPSPMSSTRPSGSSPRSSPTPTHRRGPSSGSTPSTTPGSPESSATRPWARRSPSLKASSRRRSRGGGSRSRPGPGPSP